MRSTLWMTLALAACSPRVDDGLICTEIGCGSTLTIDIAHVLPLEQGPYGINLVTPVHDIRCSVGPEFSGQATCLGWRSTDIAWTDSTVQIVLTNPFYPDENNPDGVPFTQVLLHLIQDGTNLDSQTIPVDPGEPQQPNGPECEPTCWQAIGVTTLGD